MSTFKIIQVKSKKDIKVFNKIPFIVYKNDPNWVPHIKQEVESVFDIKANKYFNHGNCVRWILLNENNDPVGRIAAFVNNKKAYSFKQPTGGIGFFECVNNYNAAILLFNTAKEWLLREGMEAMDGPINFGENNKYWGLVVDNFNFPTYHGQNYNPPYYKKFFEDFGFQVYYYQVINYRKVDDPVSGKFQTKAEGILKDKDYTIESIQIKEIDKYAEDFRAIYNAAWTTHDNFKEMSKEMVKSIFRIMKRIIDEKLVCFVYYKKQPVAFCLCIPDLNQIFKSINGNLNLYGKSLSS